MPFSIEKGVKAYIPFTRTSTQIYPNTLLFYELFSNKPFAELKLALSEYIIEQKTFINLERGWLVVELFTALGLTCRYKLFYNHDDNTYSFKLLKSLNNASVDLMMKDQRGELKIRCDVGDEVSLFRSQKAMNFTEETFTRFHFGCFKKQRWDHILERASLSEMLPFIIRLSDMLPAPKNSLDLSLLGHLDALMKSYPSTLHKEYEVHLLTFFKSYLEGLLSVRSLEPFNASPQGLAEIKSALQFKTLGQWLKKHFIEWDDENNTLFICPHLTHSTQSGRVTSFLFPNEERCVSIDVQWKSKKPYKIFIKSKQDISFNLVLPKAYTSCRLRKNRLCRRYSIHENPVKIEIQKNDTLLIDRLEK